MDKVCFSHGQDSGPWGTKISAMAETAKVSSWSVESLDYRGVQNPLDRVEMLVDYCRSQTKPPALVGSSMGGFVAAVAASRVGARGLFLLAPAFHAAIPDLRKYEETRMAVLD